MLDNMTNWSKMKKRILIGSLRGPNFAIRTAKMDRSRILVSGNFVFKTLHKRKQFVEEKDTKMDKVAKGKRTTRGKTSKPASVPIRNVQTAQADNFQKACFLFYGLFLSSLGTFVSFSSKDFFPFCNFPFESERLPCANFVTSAM